MCHVGWLGQVTMSGNHIIILLRLDTRLMIKSSRLLLKPLRLGVTIWRIANTRSSSSSITTTSNNWGIQQAWVFVRSFGPKNSFNTNLKSIITKVKQMLLPMLFFNSHREVKLEKRLYEQKTPKSSLIYMFY